MHGELSQADDRELTRLAYARNETPDGQTRAVAASEELARRAAAVEAEAEEHEAYEDRGALSNAESPAGHPKSETSPPVSARRRRMRAVGIVGVIAAVIVIPVVGWAVTQPSSEPLAIFDWPASAEDQEWAARLTEASFSNITLGPRVIDLGEDQFGIAYRASTVPDGRSTEWDLYCLVVADMLEGSSGWSGGSSCVVPSLFEAEGLNVTMGPSTEGAGLDLLTWGPRGNPRVESDQTLDDTLKSRSLLDVIAVGYRGGAALAEPFDAFEEPERLLMGPVPVFISDRATEAGVKFSAYMLEAVSVESEPNFCLQASHPDVRTATSCATLSRVERAGITTQLITFDDVWTIGVNIDGSTSSSVFPRRAD